MKPLMPNMLSAAINQALGCAAPQMYKNKLTGQMILVLRPHP